MFQAYVSQKNSIHLIKSNVSKDKVKNQVVLV